MRLTLSQSRHCKIPHKSRKLNLHVTLSVGKYIILSMSP